MTLQITEQRIKSITDSMQGKTIAVIGDLMLDRYFWGSVNRISPEAPVPIVDIDSEQIRLGGAANVASNIQSLGGNPLLIGVIGDDNSGKSLLEVVHELNFSSEGIIVDNSRPTTVKTRIIANEQHVCRIDRESREEISPTIQNQLIERLHSKINQIDGIIIEDYNKGVIVKTLIKQIVDLARKHNKIVTVDPKFNNFFEYKNVTVFKPNRKEAEEALEKKWKNDQDMMNAGTQLLKTLQAENVLLTRGAQGMTLFQSNGQTLSLPTNARTVVDVSGAGDTVIATLTLAMSGGASINEASLLANIAGGIVVGYIGIVPVQKKELISLAISNSKYTA